MGLPQTVSLDEKTKELVIVDQTLLPGELKLLRLSTLDGICEAVKELKVRGAPAIGIAAATGLYCLSERFAEADVDAFMRRLEEAADKLNSTRPTAKNLSWALCEMLKTARGAAAGGTGEIKRALREKAVQMKEDDIAVCKAIGVCGERLIEDGCAVMTICNAGALAAVEYGTALAPVYEAHRKGKRVSVFAPETRPLLQGARLTAFELTENGIDTTVICDGAAAAVLASGKISAVFTGCDRAAANGDAANKVGTLALAVLAKHFEVPFYVCAPYSSIDFGTPTGAGIEIEQRSGGELRSLWYKSPMVTDKAKIYNPAFDVTDAALITAYLTEKGIKKPSEL